MFFFFDRIYTLRKFENGSDIKAQSELKVVDVVQCSERNGKIALDLELSVSFSTLQNDHANQNNIYHPYLIIYIKIFSQLTDKHAPKNKHLAIFMSIQFKANKFTFLKQNLQTKKRSCLHLEELDFIVIVRKINSPSQ